MLYIIEIYGNQYLDTLWSAIIDDTISVKLYDSVTKDTVVVKTTDLDLSKEIKGILKHKDKTWVTVYYPVFDFMLSNISSLTVVELSVKQSVLFHRTSFRYFNNKNKYLIRCVNHNDDILDFVHLCYIFYNMNDLGFRTIVKNVDNKVSILLRDSKPHMRQILFEVDSALFSKLQLGLLDLYKECD